MRTMAPAWIAAAVFGCAVEPAFSEAADKDAAPLSQCAAPTAEQKEALRGQIVSVERGVAAIDMKIEVLRGELRDSVSDFESEREAQLLSLAKEREALIKKKRESGSVDAAVLIDRKLGALEAEAERIRERFETEERDLSVKKEMDLDSKLQLLSKGRKEQRERLAALRRELAGPSGPVCP